MSRKKIKLLDTVALVDDLSERNLKRGEVGTVVEILVPDVFEVEFSDEEGQTYAQIALRANQIIALHNQGERPRRARLEALIEEMLDGQILLAEALSEFEKLYIKKALSRNNEHLSKTAKALGVHRNTISRNTIPKRANRGVNRPFST